MITANKRSRSSSPRLVTLIKLQLWFSFSALFPGVVLPRCSSHQCDLLFVLCYPRRALSIRPNMHSVRLFCLLALLVAVIHTGSGKRRGGNVGALFAAGLGGSALGLSYGVLLAGQHRGGKGDHHHIYNYGQGKGGGGNEVQVITAPAPPPYSNGYGGYLGGYGYAYPYAGRRR